MNDPRSVFTRAVAVHSDKGGVLKTSLVANLSYVLAANGHRVLVVDVDPQGNVLTDLGMSKVSDKGQALTDAMLEQRPISKDEIVPARGGMTLDVVCGGKHLKRLERTNIPWEERFNRLVVPLQELADDYDIVMLDTPPNGSEWVNPVLGVAQHLIIPAGTDVTSIDQVADVAEVVGEAQEFNPYLGLMGVVIVGTGRRSTKQQQFARDRLAAMGLGEYVFEHFVAFADAAGKGARNEGITAHEFSALQPLRQSGQLKFLREQSEGRGTRPQPKQAYKESAEALANDYRLIAEEVVERINDREQNVEGN